MQSALRNVELDDLRDVKIVFGSLLERLDPDAVPTCDADAMWEFCTQITRMGHAAATLLARRVEDSGRWERERARSAAEYLANRAGTSISEAARMLATSKRVAKLPNTAAAMRRGELSPAKAEAIADAATVAPEAEAELLAGAEQAPLADLRERCLKAKAKDAPKAHKRIRRNRYARTYKDSEGAWNLAARGTVDDGARFMHVFQPLIDAHFKRAKADEALEPIQACAFDALMEMADLVGDTSTDAHTSTRPKRTPAKYLGLIRLDYAALARGAVEGDERCEIAGLGPIPVDVARDLLGDAILKLVITKGVDVMNITHLGRSPTVAQQVALWWSARECQRDTCTRTERLENDHRHEWHKCHETRLENIDPLCGHDHDLKTNHGWALIEGTGKRPLVPPDDPRHPKNKPKE